MEFNNDPALIEANHNAYAELRSLKHEVDSLKELNEFLRSIIISLISK